MSSTIRYNGFIYHSIKEFTETYRLPYDATLRKMRQGYTLDEIVYHKKHVRQRKNNKKTTFTYRGNVYTSIKSFCASYDLNYAKIYGLFNKGMSIQEIMLRDDVTSGLPEDAESKKRKLGGVYTITEMIPPIREIFLSNPYCILGISCNSSRLEILDAVDNYELLLNTERAEEYHSKYDLVGVDRPNRKLEHLSVIRNDVDKLEYHWIWFLSDRYSEIWNDKVFFKTFDKKIDTKNFEYDDFLACYYNVLLTNIDFSDKARWSMVLVMLNWYYNLSEDNLYNILIERISESEKDKYTIDQIISNFKKYIKTPLLCLASITDKEGLFNLISLQEWCSGNINEEISSMIYESAVHWVDLSLDKLKKQLLRFRYGRDLAYIRELCACLEYFGKNDFLELQQLQEKLPKELFCLMIKKVKGTIFEATDLLRTANRIKEACQYDSLLYIYCTEVEKKEILRVNPHEWLELPDKKYSIEECRHFAEKCKNANDWKFAISWMKRAALMGDINSQNDLGDYYTLCNMGWRDIYEAAKWYRTVAESGNAKAWEKLAEFYLSNKHSFPRGRKDAEICWMEAYRLDKNGGYKELLDKKFPGWKHTLPKPLRFSGNEPAEMIIPYAEEGILDAEYWYGVMLYKGINGCEENKKSARRWLLRAAVYNHPLAIIDLKKLYGIDANKYNNAIDMYNYGITMMESNTLQEQDLAFYWLNKARVKGVYKAEKLIGVCYIKEIGADKHTKLACEFFGSSVELGKKDLSMFSYVNRSYYGAVLYNYGINLYYGLGVEQDRTKAKECFVQSQDLGDELALQFLKDKFVMNGNPFKPYDYSMFDNVTMYDNEITIEFCGLTTENNIVKLKLWICNNDEIAHKIWMKNVKINTIHAGIVKEIGLLEKEERDFFVVSLPFSQKEIEDTIQFQIEVDDKYTKELFTLNIMQITLMNLNNTYKFESICHTGCDKRNNDTKTNIDILYNSDSDDLFVKNSYYKNNPTYNVLELYFPERPDDNMRRLLRELGWKLSKNKKYYFVRENSERKEFAKRVTGS